MFSLTSLVAGGMLTWSSGATLASVGRASSEEAGGAKLDRRARTFDPIGAFDTATFGPFGTGAGLGALAPTGLGVYSVAGSVLESDATFAAFVFAGGALDAVFDVAGGGSDFVFAMGAFIDGIFDAGAIDARFFVFAPADPASDFAFAIGVWRAVSSIEGSAFAGT